MSGAEAVVIIATRNRPSALQRMLRSLKKGVKTTTVVVDQSTEEWVSQNQEILRAYPDVAYIAAEQNGLCAARNLGLQQSIEPIVVYFDDDVYVYPNCVQEHLFAYEDGAVGAAVGRIAEMRVRWNRSDVGNAMDAFGRMRTRLWGTVAMDVQAVKGANMSFRRDVLTEIGGFDPGYAGTSYLEEVDVSQRVRQLGWRIRFLPRAEVVHFAEPMGGVRQRSPEETEYWRFYNTGILRVNTELVCRRVKLCWDFRRLRLNVLRIGGTGWHPCVLFAHFRQVGVRGDVTSPRSHKKPEIPLLSSGDPINPLGAILGVDCAKRLHFRNRFLRAPNRCDE